MVKRDGFKIDKQTLNDFAVFGTVRNQSVYEIFNRMHTRGGARRLEEMFQFHFLKWRRLKTGVRL